MSDKILLFVSSANAVAARWRGGRVERCVVLTPDEDGIAAFAGTLKTSRGTPVYVVVDTVEEDYRFETLPHATGADRASLLDRKVRHFYRSTRFVSTQFCGRVGDKRRNDRYLFAALTNPALVDPWLTAIAEQGAPVAGVYLAPMLTASLMARLKITLPRVLIAAPHAAGLRLTFFRDGAFSSSRLTRAIPRDPDDATRMLVTELSNTRLYLSTLHLDAIDDSLNVVFLDRNDSLADVAARITADGHGMECICIGRSALLQHLQISVQHLDAALETIYLGVLAEHQPANNLAPASVTAGFQLRQRRRSLYVASAAVGLTGLLWTGYNLWHAYDLNQDVALAARQTAAAQTQYREITRTFPATPTSSDNLIRAVNVYQQVVKSVRSPQPFMQLVSRAIEPHPEIFLQEISWHYSADRPEASAGTPGAPGDPGNAAPAAAAPGPGGLRQSGVLAGEIRPFQGDFRAAIVSINRVAERLAREPAVSEVKILKLPLNVNSELALSGDTRDATDNAGIAEFRILVTLKPNA